MTTSPNKSVTSLPVSKLSLSESKLNPQSSSSTQKLVPQKVDQNHENNETTKNSTKIQRRTNIPPRPEKSLNVLKFLKTTLGKELTRMSFPLVLNEPLSMIQRSMEFIEFHHLLDYAAQPELKNNPELQTALVALFTSANFMRTSDRYKKPFNPLLCETFEMDRWNASEKYRFIVEQTEHHPPVAAIYGESQHGWIYQSNLSANSTFKINCSVEIKTDGFINLYFKNTNKSYVINRPTSTYYVLASSPAIIVSGTTIIKSCDGNICSKSSGVFSPNSTENLSNTSACNSTSLEPKTVYKLINGQEATEYLSGKRKGFFGKISRGSKSESFQVYGFGENNPYGEFCKFMASDAQMN